jgi:AcrR family transcriptional regulator
MTPAHPDAIHATKDRILDVAARLFHEQGYNATGVATILREARVNAGSLYHFFPSKEALLVGVLQRYVELLKPIVLSPQEERTDDPIERVFALLAWYRMGLEMTGCTMGCPIGNLAIEVGDSHPEIRSLIDLNFRNWARGVRSWLDAAADRLPPDTDREQLAHFILTVMEGGIMQARASGNLEPYDASVAQLRAYFDLLEKSAPTPPRKRRRIPAKSSPHQ